VNVSKDSLHHLDALVAKASLWDANDQCKPAFFAVADVGKNYNALDSLIAYGNLLHENEHTIESLASFASALVSARSPRPQNCSASVSAAAALGQAKDSLKSAIDGLVEIFSGVDLANGNSPKTFALSQNCPNPLYPTTRINYSIPDNGYVTLKVYDLLGKEVATVFEGIRQPGNYEATFDGNRLAAAVYLYRLSANGVGGSYLQLQSKSFTWKKERTGGQVKTQQRRRSIHR
jgi:hypothetical protein